MAGGSLKLSAPYLSRQLCQGLMVLATSPPPCGPPILCFLGDQMLMRWYVSAGTSLPITRTPHLGEVGKAGPTLWIASAKGETEQPTWKKTNASNICGCPPENLSAWLFCFFFPSTCLGKRCSDPPTNSQATQIIVSLVINQQLLWDSAHKRCHDPKQKLDANCFWKNVDTC